MIEVFKTNVQEVRQSVLLTSMLQQYLPGSDIHFDLEDCDRILRVQYPVVQAAEVASLLKKHGFHCEALED